MRYFNIVFKYFYHWITARNTRGYGVHSPSLFHFVRFILTEKHPFYFFEKIGALTEALKEDKTTIQFKDFGTGIDKEKTVASIASGSVISARHGQLLYRMVNYYRPNVVLELGTSLGISTAYLAAANSALQCYSLEGCDSVASLAAVNLQKLQLRNVEIIRGNIDDTLGDVLNRVNQLDFVFIDANHRFEPTVRYFEMCLPKSNEHTVFVFDDIYWSADMERAWNYIKNHQSVSSTIDIFQMGIVYINPKLAKKQYKVRY